MNQYIADEMEYEEKIEELEAKVREFEEAGAECVAIKKAQAENAELQKQLEKEIAFERKQRAIALKRWSRLRKAKEKLESKYQEAVKTVEIQRERLTPLN